MTKKRLLDPENVRDISAPVRFNTKEYLKILACSKQRGLTYAATVRALAIERALQEEAALAQQSATVKAA